MEATESLNIVILKEQEGQRIDKVCTDALAGQYSRSKVQSWIDEGLLEPKKNSSHKVSEGEEFVLNIPEEKPVVPQPQNIPLNIVYEDDYLLVINKSADMVVHPGAGNDSDTLVNALLYHCKGKLSDIGGPERPGIVHRLDKETSGLMVAAKTNEVHADLTEQLARRDVSRTYNAVVWGLIPDEGVVDADIGRAENNRQKMAVREEGGKEAVTEFVRLETFGLIASLAECHLHTGRTHQIRVHMAHIGHWLVGDPIYGKNSIRKFLQMHKINQELTETLLSFPRQALHAVALEFIHPISGEEMSFKSELPEDMTNLLNSLREYKRS